MEKIGEYFTMNLDYMKEHTSVKLEIKKFNKNNQLCYYDSIDLTCKGFTDEQIEIFSNLFISAGFKINIKKSTYFGIYDPSRMAELVEIYPTDEELLERDLRFTKIVNKREKLFGII